MYKQFLLLLLILLAFCSCGMVSIQTNGLNSKYEKTNKEYPGLLVTTDSTTAVCSLGYTEKPAVYVVKAPQLQQCLAEYENAMIYIWDAHCTSKECYSPSLLQNYCDRKNIELFVVCEYYDGKELTQFYEIKRPIFGIDTKYYNSDYTDKYVARFSADLNATDKETGRMLYFKKGEYMGKAKLEFEGEE